VDTFTLVLVCERSESFLPAGVPGFVVFGMATVVVLASVIVGFSVTATATGFVVTVVVVVGFTVGLLVAACSTSHSKTDGG